MAESMSLTYEPVFGLRPRPTENKPAPHIELPAPHLGNTAPLMAALEQRRSTREFAPAALTPQQLSDLLWAANGINRPATGGRTAPSAHALYEVDIYVALPDGLYRYNVAKHRLDLKRAVDARNLTGYQDFVGEAPLDLVYVVSHSRIAKLPLQQRETFAAACAGAICQNVSLYCAATALVTVVRGWLNHRQLAEAMSLNEDEVPVLAQTVGHPVPSA